MLATAPHQNLRRGLPHWLYRLPAKMDETGATPGGGVGFVKTGTGSCPYLDLEEGVAPVHLRFARSATGRSGTEAYDSEKQDMTGKSVVNRNGRFCESTPMSFSRSRSGMCLWISIGSMPPVAVRSARGYRSNLGGVTASSRRPAGPQTPPESGPHLAGWPARCRKMSWPSSATDLPGGIGSRMIRPPASLPAGMILATVHPRRISGTGWLIGSTMAYHSCSTY